MNLLPRDEKFFQYFQQQVKLICQAADLLVEGATAGNAHLANAAHQIHVLEEQADSVLHEIYTRLNSTFIHSIPKTFNPFPPTWTTSSTASRIRCSGCLITRSIRC